MPMNIALICKNIAHVIARVSPGFLDCFMGVSQSWPHFQIHLPSEHSLKNMVRLAHSASLAQAIPAPFALKIGQKA
jgi:hypothetical protein